MFVGTTTDAGCLLDFPEDPEDIERDPSDPRRRAKRLKRFVRAELRVARRCRPRRVPWLRALNLAHAAQVRAWQLAVSGRGLVRF